MFHGQDEFFGETPVGDDHEPNHTQSSTGVSRVGLRRRRLIRRLGLRSKPTQRPAEFYGRRRLQRVQTQHEKFNA